MKNKIGALQIVLVLFFTTFAFAQPSSEVLRPEDQVNRSAQNLYSVLASLTCPTPGNPEPVLSIQNVGAAKPSSGDPGVPADMDIYVTWTSVEGQCGPVDQYLGNKSISSGEIVEVPIKLPGNWAYEKSSDPNKTYCPRPAVEVRMVPCKTCDTVRILKELSCLPPRITPLGC